MPDKPKPIMSAGDHSPEALAGAAANWRMMRADWCTCGDPNDFECMAYYRDPTSGSHGWLCAKCLGIIQTG